MKLIVFSDAHGDATTSGFDRCDDIEGAFAEVVEGARKEKVDLAIFLGDLTDPDTSRSHRAVAMAAHTANELRNEGIESRWIVGNHDIVEDGRGTNTLSAIAGAGFKVFAEPNIESGSGIVYLPYPPRSKTYTPEVFIRENAEVLLSSMRGELGVIVAGHLMIRGADPGSESADFARGRDVFYPGEACRELFGKDALLLNGHYHRRQCALHGIQIPGSLARLRHDEEKHTPGYLICEREDKRGAVWTVKTRHIKARQLVTIPVKDRIWVGGSLDVNVEKGAIVRIQPPSNADDRTIDDLVSHLERTQAVARIRVEPQAKGVEVATKEKASPEPRRTARQVVLQMVDESRTKNKIALLDVCEGALTKQGL